MLNLVSRMPLTSGFWKIMNKLAEETFGQSVHFWYDGLPLYKDGTYAKELQLSDNLKLFFYW